MTYLGHIVDTGGELRANREKNLIFPTFTYYRPGTLDRLTVFLGPFHDSQEKSRDWPA